MTINALPPPPNPAPQRIGNPWSCRKCGDTLGVIFGNLVEWRIRDHHKKLHIMKCYLPVLRECGNCQTVNVRPVASDFGR